MSFFDDLPAAGSTWNSADAYGQYGTHGWLFNAGSGTDVLDLVAAVNAVLSGTYTWLSKGITFNGGKATPPNFTLAQPFGVIVGLNLDSVSGWQAALGLAEVLGFNGTTISFYATSGTTYLDGSASSGPVSTGVNYVVGWHVTGANVVNPVIGSDQWNEYLLGDVAFLYVFAGAPDWPALMAAIYANPYRVITPAGITRSPSVGSLAFTGGTPARLVDHRPITATGVITMAGGQPGVVIPGLAQFARPISDVAAGSWTYSEGATLYACVDEVTAADADYIRSAASPTNDTAILGLTSLNTPGPGAVTLRVRARYVS
jgi:hypothetical protein